MAKKKGGKVIQFQPISLTNYIKEHARKLPFGICYTVKADKRSLQQFFISRVKKNGSVLVGTYMVDGLCLGVKDSFYLEFPDHEDFEDFFREQFGDDLIEVDPVYAQNYIYGALEYAEEAGFKPHADFKISEYILDDAAEIDFIDIEFGSNGKYLYFEGPYDNPKQILATLEKNLRKDQYEHIPKPPFFDDEFEDDEISNNDLWLDFQERYTEKIDDLLLEEEKLGDKFYLNHFENTKNEYDELVAAIITIHALLATKALGVIWDEEENDEEPNNKFKENPEKYIEQLIKKVLEDDKEILEETGLSKEDFENMPFETIIYNNLIFDSNFWVYLPEYKKAVNFSINENIGDIKGQLAFFEFLGPLKIKIGFYLRILSMVVAEHELGYNPLEMSDKQKNIAFEKTIDMFIEYYENEEDEVNFVCDQPQIQELDLIFDYYPFMTKAEFMNLDKE
jgi:hypothetical protein